MCTAATYRTKNFYFGRTLDYEHSFREEVTVSPRNLPFHFRNGKLLAEHYALIGMAYVTDNTPLYFDAVNEKGLCMAGLNFVGYAHYHEPAKDMNNIAQFEFIPWILGQCDSVDQARNMLEKTNITDWSYSDQLAASQLHWIVSDRTESITVESIKDGLKVYDNPVGVLTNNPGFPEQMHQLSNYMHLSPRTPENRFAPGISMNVYSRGMGALGLPGDLSSQSRFVRAAFVKMNSISGDSEEESVSQFFHILASVDQQRGCCVLDNDANVTTVYTSCCNADRGIYYYTTYDNHQISCVDMHRVDLSGNELARYPLVRKERFFMQNA